MNLHSDTSSLTRATEVLRNASLKYYSKLLEMICYVREGLIVCTKFPLHSNFVIKEHLLFLLHPSSFIHTGNSLCPRNGPPSNVQNHRALRILLWHQAAKMSTPPPHRRTPSMRGCRISVSPRSLIKMLL